jgi:hypothetical protein
MEVFMDVLLGERGPFPEGSQRRRWRGTYNSGVIIVVGLLRAPMGIEAEEWPQHGRPRRCRHRAFGPSLFEACSKDGYVKTVWRNREVDANGSAPVVSNFVAETLFQLEHQEMDQPR